MTTTPEPADPGPADHAALRTRARGLRHEGLSRRQIRDRLGIRNNDLLNVLLDGTPLPERKNRTRAKDGLRARARELRLQGWTYDRIERELGVSGSSVSLWVRDLPEPPRQRSTQEQARLAARKRREHEHAVRDAERRRTVETARAGIGSLTDRELLLIGVGLYWSEGCKSKPYKVREEATFVNSDPGMILVYLAWLDLLDVPRERRQFRVMIHERADVTAAEAYWADLVGVEVGELAKTTLKRHNPKTVRKNVGADYRGCLTVRIRKGAELYRRIEGWWYGIVEASTDRGSGKPPTP